MKIGQLIAVTLDKLKNNTLTRTEADECIESMIKIDKNEIELWNGKISTQKRWKDNLTMKISGAVIKLCDNGFKLSIDQFIRLAKSNDMMNLYGPAYKITDYYSGKEMYEYCVKKNKILNILGHWWRYFTNVPNEMIDFVINHNKSNNHQKYQVLQNLSLVHSNIGYIDKYLTFYENNMKNHEFRIYCDVNNLTYDLAKRYIAAKYRLGQIYGGVDFFHIINKFNEPKQQDELYNTLLEAIEHNHKNNKDNKYDIYTYIDNILFYGSKADCYNKDKNIPIKVLLRILPKMNYCSLRRNIFHYQNILSYDMHKCFLEHNILPKIFSTQNIYEFLKKYDIKKYYNEDKINDIEFLKDFHEAIEIYFKDFEYDFPIRYDSELIKNIKTRIILARQLIMMFDLHTTQKIDLTTYIYKMIDQFEQLDDKIKIKYQNDFNEFYRLFSN
jgi:hypothetical protein